mmetsp:Transcript_14587/g.12390  ORF Transcript_14587/g.12390 Transcript_14587/m.12390 type:complete len:392 (+) Transcript_14587:59-1234(+)
MKSLFTKFTAKFSSSKPIEQLEKTALYNYHVDKLKAKMTNFNDHAMPVQYPMGTIKEHIFCRENSALFDVSHMGQVKVYGKDRNEFMERIVVGDVTGCGLNQNFYTLILNERAGIQDDAVVSRFEDHLNVVVNAGNKYKDIQHMKDICASEFAKKDVRIEYLTDRVLLALQGPKAHVALQQVLDIDLSKVYFNTHLIVQCKKIGADIQIVRAGYTGEDGFEISVPSSQAESFCDLLLANDFVAPAGLGSRDTLRLEAGLCLWGNDLDENTNPAQAVLMWTVRKNPETKFIGYEALEANKKKLGKKRAGFEVIDKGILRPGMTIEDEAGAEVGVVCSGTHTPTLQKAIGMCYIKPPLAKVDQELYGVSRGKKLKLKIAKMPFIPHTYYRAPE